MKSIWTYILIFNFYFDEIYKEVRLHAKTSKSLQNSLVYEFMKFSFNFRDIIVYFSTSYLKRKIFTTT